MTAVPTVMWEGVTHSSIFVMTLMWISVVHMASHL
jgi:hypothetical protein